MTFSLAMNLCVLLLCGWSVLKSEVSTSCAWAGYAKSGLKCVVVKSTTINMP